tara:strand:- start:1050 stop:1268 length:219 start_codon:yes stop_codon:yes gene_type:complete
MEKQTTQQIITEGLIKHYEGVIALAKGNIQIYLNNSVGIGEHIDILEAVDKDLEKIASAQDKIEMIQKYFVN